MHIWMLIQFDQFNYTKVVHANVNAYHKQATEKWAVGSVNNERITSIGTFYIAHCETTRGVQVDLRNK